MTAGLTNNIWVFYAFIMHLTGTNSSAEVNWFSFLWKIQQAI